MGRGEVMRPPAREPLAQKSRLWLSFGSIVMPILRCALCPVCVGTFGSVVAGARLGFLADQRLHGVLILFAIAIDTLMLAASMRHHHRTGPLLLCTFGSCTALLAHFALQVEPVEYAGFALLMFASIWNVRLLLAHRLVDGSCCPHDRQQHAHGQRAEQRVGGTRELG
jgi:hypothetical protein